MSSAPIENPLRHCEAYLRMAQQMGAMFGDFYLDLGRNWAVPSQPPVAHPRGQVRQCYQNSFNLAQDQGLIYCEGFAMPQGLIPVHHAWCVTPDGEVLEPTWKSMGVEYFGVALDSLFVSQFLLKHKVWGVLGDRVPSEVIDNRSFDFLHSTLRNDRSQLQHWTAKLDRVLHRDEGMPQIPEVFSK